MKNNPSICLNGKLHPYHVSKRNCFEVLLLKKCNHSVTYMLSSTLFFSTFITSNMTVNSLSYPLNQRCEGKIVWIVGLKWSWFWLILTRFLSTNFTCTALLQVLQLYCFILIFSFPSNDILTCWIEVAAKHFRTESL